MNPSNKKITFKGNPVKVLGTELKVGDILPAFKLTGTDMSDITSDKFRGKKLIVVAVPSLDTPVCQMETKKFNQAAGEKKDTAILVVSLDLPFAQKRWCGAEGVNAVVVASDYKYRTFGDAFGLYVEDLGLLTRAVFVADEAGKIKYVDYMSDITNEPNYEEVLSAI